MQKLLICILFAMMAFSSTVKAQGCIECETIIQLVETWVESNATDTEILQYLDTICNLFSQYAPVCDSIASQGLKQVLVWINQNESPSTICEQLGLCTSLKLQKVKPVAKPIGDGECDSCETIVGTIENWIENANNQDEVITAIEVVCTYMPGWENFCDLAFSYGIPKLVNWIAENENSSQLCVQLGACQAKVEVVTQIGDDCDSCEEIVTAIEIYIANNTTETAIENIVDIACALIPQWQNICDTVVSEEVPQIIDWINENQTPSQICTQLGLCSSQKKNVQVN